MRKQFYHCKNNSTFDDVINVCAIGEVCTFFTICDVAVWEELVGETSVSG